MPKKAKLKNRVIVIITKETPERFFVGGSASAIAEVMGLHKMTLSRSALLAELNGGKYENPRYTLYVTDKFVRGKNRGGGFSYSRH